MGETFDYLSAVAKYIGTIWLAFWAYRRHYDLDYPLDRTGQMIRWSAVVLGLSLALLNGPEFARARIAGGMLMLAFLAWPNFAYHLRESFRRSDGKNPGKQ